MYITFAQTKTAVVMASSCQGQLFFKDIVENSCEQFRQDAKQRTLFTVYFVCSLRVIHVKLDRNSFKEKHKTIRQVFKIKVIFKMKELNWQMHPCLSKL